MKLYKYVAPDALQQILQSQRMMFSHPADFNDPFDRPRVSRSAYDGEYHSLFTGELMTRERQAKEADAGWAQCAVSSFTRTHDNGLMWAHYADKHKGAVIEFDVEIAGLTSRTFLIPIQFGSVIYMKRPNPDRRLSREFVALRDQMVRSGEDRFEIDNYEGLQRLFLTKGLAWAYEEEVRVVCEPFRYGWAENGESFLGDWKRIPKDDGSFGYLWRLAPRSISRVFAGLRFGNLGQLREQAAVGGFELMRPDLAPHDDYELHFLPDSEPA
jgi:hypothetical protein